MTTEAGGPIFGIRVDVEASAAHPADMEHVRATLQRAFGHDPDHCGECKREREREAAMQNDRPILDTRNHVDDPALD